MTFSAEITLGKPAHVHCVCALGHLEQLVVAIGAFEAFFIDMLLVAEDHLIGIFGRERDIAAPGLFGVGDGRQ
jgi:hypothetical protein